MLIAALVLILLLSPSIALAEDIPEYDTQAHCERVAESAAKPSAALGRCLWLEEYALDELETFWPRASNAVREECLEATSGEESYVVLARCVMARLQRSRLGLAIHLEGGRARLCRHGRTMSGNHRAERAIVERAELTNERGRSVVTNEAPHARSPLTAPAPPHPSNITGAEPCDPSRLRLWASCLQTGLRAWSRLPRIFALGSKVGHQHVR